MKIHEYQAKGILRRYHVPVPQGEVVFSAEEAKQVAEKLGGRVVVKAQIHAGGRGKGGGVKIAESADEAEKLASQILGMTLVTHQTGPQGQLVRKVLIEEACAIEKEYYVGLIAERRAKSQYDKGIPGCGHLAYEGLSEAMEHYEKAQKLSPENNDEAVLRWNTCARIIDGHPDIVPAPASQSEPLELE